MEFFFYGFRQFSKKSCQNHAKFSVHTHAITTFDKLQHLFELNGIKDRDRAFFLARIKVRIGIPRLLNVRVPEPARDLLNVDSGVSEQGCVTMSEIVDPDMRKAGFVGVFGVSFFDTGVAQRRLAATDAEIGREALALLLASSVFL